ncbi:MAG: WhiB family transcriptional regulator [Kitasatospora sp.]|jgi:WhiB family redox-sensing transcriptional regulator|nr:WhiB family transcriptional regulator [Kitasatospora sp.]
MPSILAPRSQPAGNSMVALARAAEALDAPLPCRASHPHLWFSDRPAELELAKARCRPCPLREACLAGALQRSEPCGVWGGEIFDHGRVVGQKKPRGRPPKRRGAGTVRPAA